ncbi:hypothetical protein BJY24_007143 [Nocardia transvalensis]|uniref:Thioesterase superfamily protein n=1 Tax=Nocardia transvalensis TaxID=37333 RepID=A0A7W9PLE3_9NOCA|nr:thioesterase family protein [Nocardia transvalensis]MBB5918231.1 hypothetical protein [Nocardia transvalensis]
MEAFFLPDGRDPGVFHPTELTRGPWAADAQHGGAPAALAGYVIGRCEPWGRVARVAVEYLGVVPIAPLRAEVRVVEAEARVGGRRVEMVEATLSSGQRVVVKATAWRLGTVAPDLEVPPEILPDGNPLGPDGIAMRPEHSFPSNQRVGFHTGVEYRFVSGAFRTPGPAVCWFRLRYPVVAGAEPAPLERVLAAADFGNGVSAVLPWGHCYFINTDLTVNMYREPVGEWVCLDAVTRAEPDGIGLAESRLFDERGPIGRGTQTLLLGTR